MTGWFVDSAAGGGRDKDEIFKISRWTGLEMDTSEGSSG